MVQLFLKLPELTAIFTATLDPDDDATGGWNYFFDFNPSIFDLISIKEFSFDFDDGLGAVIYTPDELITANGMKLASGEQYIDGVSYTVTFIIYDLFGRSSTYSVTFEAGGAPTEFSTAFSSDYS